MGSRSEDDHFLSFPNVWTLSQKLPWKGEKEKTLLDETFFILGKTLGAVFPGGSVGKEFACNAGDSDSNPCVGKIPWRSK